MSVKKKKQHYSPNLILQRLASLYGAVTIREDRENRCWSWTFQQDYKIRYKLRIKKCFSDFLGCYL